MDNQNSIQSTHFYEDDLIDDVMNIVKNDDNSKNDDFIYKEYNVVDETSGNDENVNSDLDSELEEYEECEIDEIDKMLEKPIDIMNKKDDLNYYTYDKIQIKNLYWRGCQDTMLPEGWVQVTHACGMPLYLNRQTRVCTLSRPYFIGQSSARKHDIPISAIPCLAYKKRKEDVEKQIKEHKANNINNKFNKKCPIVHIENDKSEDGSMQTTLQTDTNINNNNNEQNNNNNNNKLNSKVTVSIQSNEEKAKENILPPEKVHDYCKQLFEFDIIKVKKFKTWNDRKKFMRKSKQKKFPDNAKILKIQTKTQKGINKELTINITNKTPLSILYEYACQVFKANPRFEIQEKENPKDPFQAICYINDKLCGKGNGNSKKAAKNNAAEEALKVLIPEYKSQNNDTKKNTDDMYSFFDGYNVEHSHIYNLSQSLGAPLPYEVLLTCLKYNFAINLSRNRKEFIEEEIKPIKFRNCLYRMKLAQYDVEVNCTRKKEGRQLAAQKILKLMHPHVQTWGSILRLYGSRVAESYLKNEIDKNDDNSGDESKKNSEQQQQQQQQKAKPNKELLEKLKEEMRKIKKPSTIGTIQLNLQTGPVKQDSLLTIAPLVMPNSQINSKIDENKEEENENENDKILLTSSNNESNNKMVISNNLGSSSMSISYNDNDSDDIDEIMSDDDDEDDISKNSNTTNDEDFTQDLF